MSLEVKPSAEIQAVVMNLWNVVREVAQANAATQAENKAFAQKYHALNEQMHQEQERHTKLQAYAEHLQEEIKKQQHDFEALQQEQSGIVEINFKREETIQELRGLHLEQEEVLTRRSEENTALREQLSTVQEELERERERFHTSLEMLKQDLATSRQQALNVASEVDEVKAELDNLRGERNTLFEDNEQLRWRLQALEQQMEQDRLVMERKIEDARLHSGEMTMQLEDAKRWTSESEERIQALTEERSRIKLSLEKAEQEAQTWQQIAEEQTVRITELQSAEQELTEKLTQEFTQKFEQQQRQTKEEQTAFFEQQLEQVRQESSLQLASELASTKNLYETALDNLKNQLQETRLQHQQTLQSYTDDHEQTVTALEKEVVSLQHQYQEQLTIAQYEQHRVQELQILAEQSIHLSDSERSALTSMVKHLLERVEVSLKAFEA